MKLRFRQRFFSWFDSYDIYDESEKVYFTVEGALSLAHYFNVYDSNHNYLGHLKEQLFRFLPHFSIYKGETKVGEVIKRFSLLMPRFSIDYNGWSVQGDVFQWDYQVVDKDGKLIASINKELLHFTDVYCLDVVNEKDAYDVLMIVLAIDAVKCNQSRNNQ